MFVSLPSLLPCCFLRLILISALDAVPVWYFKSRMSWWAYKVIAVLAAIMSILVLWCEMAIPLPIDLSVFGLVVENAGTTFGKQVRRSQQPNTHTHTHTRPG